MVGRSGSNSDRAAVVTARARSLPFLMYSIDVAMLSNIACTWPLIRSVSAGAVPRYGTWTKLTSAIILNSSPDIWLEVPIPGEAKLILQVLDLEKAMTSATDLTGTDELTPRTLGTKKILATGAMSRIKLKLRLSYKDGLIRLPAATRRSV